MSDKRSVLILGSHGALGHELLLAAARAGYSVTGLSRASLDICNAREVREQLGRIRPTVVINATAYNDVDGAESPDNRWTAMAVNATGPGLLAAICGLAGIPFMHFSTDYVFDGAKAGGYEETDQPNPVSVYGLSKAEGETALRHAIGLTYVVRTSKLFGPAAISAGAKPSFADTMLKLAKTKKELRVVDDEIGCPSHTPDVARAAIALLTERAPKGVYHLVNDGPGVTWYGFARELFAVAGLDVKVVPVPSSEFPKAARRPKSAVLLNTKRPALPTRLDALARYLHTRGNLRSSNL